MAGRRGDRSRLPDAASALAGRYFPLARSMARRFFGRYRGDRDELESAACWGLMRAAELWESPRGIDPSRLARYWIAASLHDAVKRRKPLGYIHPRHGPPPPTASIHDAESEPIDPLSEPIGLGLERDEEVGRMLALLPTRHAHAVRLVCLDGRGTDEAAIAIGVTRDYVRRMVREARACFAA